LGKEADELTSNRSGRAGYQDSLAHIARYCVEIERANPAIHLHRTAKGGTSCAT
jgi:hypothetical protein